MKNIEADLTLDLRGLSCPEPVLKSKQALDNQNLSALKVIIDDEVNVQNLERLARSQKCSFSWVAQENHFVVLISRLNKADQSIVLNKEEKTELQLNNNLQVQAVIFINKDRFGEGDPEFSTNLLNLFLQTVLQSGHKPQAILLANTGVKIMAKNSPFLKVLNDFEKIGVEILACGLCVDYYGLKEDIPAKQITNMFAIGEYLFSAQKIIYP